MEDLNNLKIKQIYKIYRDEINNQITSRYHLSSDLAMVKNRRYAALRKGPEHKSDDKVIFSL